jgi:hypothetical protein
MDLMYPRYSENGVFENGSKVGFFSGTKDLWRRRAGPAKRLPHVYFFSSGVTIGLPPSLRSCERQKRSCRGHASRNDCL